MQFLNKINNNNLTHDYDTRHKLKEKTTPAIVEEDSYEIKQVVNYRINKLAEYVIIRASDKDVFFFRF